MKRNENKFNDNLLAFHRNKKIGILEGVTSTNITTGSEDRALKILPENIQKAINKKWQEIVTKKTGYKPMRIYGLLSGKKIVNGMVVYGASWTPNNRRYKRCTQKSRL